MRTFYVPVDAAAKVPGPDGIPPWRAGDFLRVLAPPTLDREVAKAVCLQGGEKDQLIIAVSSDDWVVEAAREAAAAGAPPAADPDEAAAEDAADPADTDPPATGDEPADTDPPATGDEPAGPPAPPPPPSPPPPAPPPPPAGALRNPPPKGSWKLAFEGLIPPERVGNDFWSFFGPANKSWGCFEVPHSKRIGNFVPGGDRFSIGPAPDGTRAMKAAIPHGAVVNYMAVTDVLPPGIQRAWFEGWWFVPNGFIWPADGGQKIGVAGVFIGGTPRAIGGGVMPADQTGIAIRNVHSGDSGFRLYDYDLLRKGKPGVDPKKSQMFGRVGLKASGRLPTGRWVRVAYDVTMDTGHRDGRIDFWVDDRLIETAAGLDLGHSRGFRLRGFLFNDMWGGNEDDDENLNKAGPQAYWFGRHRILLPA